MAHILCSKHIIVGVTGGIAAYKSAELVRKLREVGARVRVVMTKNAKKFITPLTMQALSCEPVHDDLFDLHAEAAMGHIELARWADAILIAPASADFIARLYHGEANDLLTTLCLATQAPLAMAPAMNQMMWKNVATQTNIQGLYARGVHIFGPEEGSQACGDTGPGRMIEPTALLSHLALLFQPSSLTGKKVIVTAGPTHEAIDPVRFIANKSSGKMGYALAKAAKEAGAKVVLISGPVALPPPLGVTLVRVTSAIQMLQAVMEHLPHGDIFFGVAAVCDYKPKFWATHKIAKHNEPWQLALEPNPDIIAQVAASTPKPWVVGFAAQTEDVFAKACAKRAAKNLDMIIANQVGEDIGMGTDDNAVTVIWEEGTKTFAKMLKEELAHKIVALVAEVVDKKFSRF